MQKPQQRKYHSSCNRSVHRGTAHGKQEVKVCKRKTPHLLMRSFLSPYGDGTTLQHGRFQRLLFSPPYGDGTSMRELVARTGLFSPPYGDGTKIGDIEHEMSSFSSPYGDGTASRFDMTDSNEFSPPYGDGTKFLSEQYCGD